MSSSIYFPVNISNISDGHVLVKRGQRETHKGRHSFMRCFETDFHSSLNALQNSDHTYKTNILHANYLNHVRLISGVSKSLRVVSSVISNRETRYFFRVGIEKGKNRRGDIPQISRLPKL